MMATSPRRNFSSQTIPPPPGDPSKNPYTTSKAESISEISLGTAPGTAQPFPIAPGSEFLPVAKAWIRDEKRPPGEFHPEVEIV